MIPPYPQVGVAERKLTPGQKKGPYDPVKTHAHARRAPGKLVLAGCSRKCSLNPGNVPAQVTLLVTKWFEDGATLEGVRKNLLEMTGEAPSVGAIGQHRKNHLHPAAGVDKIDPNAKPMGELEILDKMIQSGAKQVGLESTRISAEQLLRAIELKQKLTEGSVFDAMYEAMKGVGEKDFDAPKPPEDDPAVAAQKEGDTDVNA